MRERRVADYSALPDYGFGPKSPMWWGTLGFCALEGMGFAIACATYLYLAFVNPEWPINARPPDLLAGTLVTILLLASVVPNHILKAAAERESIRAVRIWMPVMSAFGAAPLVLRWFEFGMLNIRWDSNAYGSAVWVLLGLHTTHLITDVGDTLVLAALMWTRFGRSGKRFSDVSDNAFYWDFVVLTWLPLYVLIYWVPRL
ncbi:cytochrome c oxidase subunit 3 [Propylenella binzhouense]|uniref:Cytochrome C oxidase subunit III n=1 Tax=Propylenella binzhouense TaxID=2555902 RepID=A0A964WSK6_9HYPH|nr:cytochrome c oxidase subunit 3 [Propylenella binzhouense]MYZ47073.1 cytochrome C oxidase subunit III [Propylenella binzhouense]